MSDSEERQGKGEGKRHTIKVPRHIEHLYKGGHKVWLFQENYQILTAHLWVGMKKENAMEG